MSSISDCLKRSNDSVISPINSEFLQASFEKQDIYQINEDKLDFFQSFCSFRSLEVLKIKGFKMCETRTDNYAAYFIHIKTKDVDYVISRRYSEFYELFQAIKKNHKEVYVHNFPEKKWFGSKKKKVIEERMVKLDDFVAQLVRNCQQFKLFEILSFLAIDRAYEYFGYNLKTFSFDKVKIHACNKDDEEALDLLIQININRTNFSKILKDFENLLFERKVVISNKVAQILLLGDNQLKGFIEICGQNSSDDSSSHFQCNAGLNFFASLFNHEKNPGAEEFIKIFTSSHLKQLGLLNLASHILLTPSKNCKNHALMILKTYLDGNPNLSRFQIETILESEEAYLEFLKWKKINQIVSQKTEGFHVGSEKIFEKALSIFEEINSFSATVKKIKSPLFKRKIDSFRCASHFKKAQMACGADLGKKS